MTGRKIDWRAFLNRLQYCYGCGRFGLPRGGKVPGWNVLYQPHAEGPVGLNVCSEKCAGDVRAAMAKGPVTEPLHMAAGVTMDGEMRKAMLDEAIQFAIDEGRMDDLFLDAMQDQEPKDEGEP